MVVQKLGLYGLAGATCHLPHLCLDDHSLSVHFLFSTVQLVFTQHTILIWILYLLLVLQILELYGLAGGPIFPRHGGSSVARHFLTRQ